ncbi:MAG: hypothetical protein KDA84_17510 [Planctomycetaceae bacterium]|nr:hypothetical protein [Planctomycetaceae bacterium]
MVEEFFISLEEHNPPSSEAEKIDALLDLLADPRQFTSDEDLDLVIDSALAGLLQFPKLPARTIDIMLGILAIDDHGDLILTRKMMATKVLCRMGQQVNSAGSMV